MNRLNIMPNYLSYGMQDHNLQQDNNMNSHSDGDDAILTCRLCGYIHECCVCDNRYWCSICSDYHTTGDKMGDGCPYDDWGDDEE